MPEMNQSEALGFVLDKVMGRAEPDVAEAIRFCAIPHWFDEEVLGWLRGEACEPSGRTREILIKLTKLVFVSPYHDRGYKYHEDVRKLLLRRWREETPQRFQELSGMAAAYYANRLQVGESSGEQGAEWEREEMYHLLVADERRGIDLFIGLLDEAGQSCRFSTFDLLLKWAREQKADLSSYSRPWLRFYEGKRELLSGNWKEALKKWEALEGERGQVSADLEKTLAAHLSFLYKDKGEWDKAVECLWDSLEILKQMGDKRGMAGTLNNLSFLYKDKGEWDKAVECLQHSLEILEQMGDECGMVDTFNCLGLLYKDEEEWEEADKHFRRGLEILERGMATILGSLGFLYKDKKEWERADGYFQRSLEIFERVSDERGKADAFNNLGFLYTDKKEWEEADRYFQQGLGILEGLRDKRGMVDTFNNLGSLYKYKGEWEKADGYFRQGLEILQELHDERGAATVFNNLGLLYKDKGEREKAVEYFRRSLKIVEEVGDEMNTATAMYNLAFLYEDMGKYDEAVELLEKVVRICERVGHTDLRIRRSREALEKVRKRAG